MAGRHPLTKALGLVAPGESISAEQENILRRIATQQLDLVDCIQDSTGIRQARPTVSAGGCNTIRFEICEPDCETCSAEVIILSRPPGGDVEGEANGKVTQLGRGLMPIDAMEKKYWRNMRFALKDAPPRANLVRLNVLDDAAAINEWVAFTPPRVPALRTLNEVVGRTDPVFIDWMPGLVFPCQRPMAVSYGILEVPDWRIMPDAEATKRNTQTWSAGVNGGPLGITEGLLNHTLVSTYLRNNWGRDWGGLERFSMVVEAEPAEMVHGTHRVSGLYNPAPMRSKGY